MNIPKVLLVDDDGYMRGLLAKMLRVRDIEVYEAENGAVAAKIFESGQINFSVIVSDIRMPEMDGIELLKRIRAKSQVPFVIFTGLNKIEESQKAFDLGANEFITKPVDKECIQKIIAIFNQENASRAELAAKRELGPEDFREIKIEEFLSTSTLQSDVYIRLSKTRFVKIAKKGDLSPRDRISYYREHKIEMLYVLHADYGVYVTMAAEITTRALAAPNMPDATKMSLLQTSAKIMVEHCFVSPELDKKAIDSAQQIVENAVKFAATQPAILEQLAYLNSQTNRLYAHSVAVAFYSALVARSYGWDSETTLTRIALGGLLHDIGKRDMPLEVLYKPRKELTREETALLETHCARGRDILVTVKGLPEEVALIAMNHHECRSGTGFPRRLKGEQVSAHVRLVHVVDKFCSMTNPICPTDPATSSHDSITKMEVHYSDDLDPVFFTELAQLMGAPLDEKGTKAS